MEAFGRKKVQPIRKKQDIENIKYYLLKKVNIAKTIKKKKIHRRNQFIFIFGINSALRISDILDLKVKDVKNGFVYIKDKKTKKINTFEINEKLFQISKTYIEEQDMIDEDYLFKNFIDQNKPISKPNLHYLFKKIEKECNLNYNINTHSLRKTYGYHFYKQTKDIYTLSKILNHSNTEITQHYIGLLDDDKNKARKNFEIGL